MNWSEINLTETESNAIQELSGEGVSILNKPADKTSRRMLLSQIMLGKSIGADSATLSAAKRALEKAKKAQK